VNRVRFIVSINRPRAAFSAPRLGVVVAHGKSGYSAFVKSRSERRDLNVSHGIEMSCLTLICALNYKDNL